MGRVHDTAKLCKAGNDPNSIAGILGISVSSVEGYLNRAIGEGLLRRSDIYFSVPPERRQSGIVAQYANARGALGDLYDDIRRIEVMLHTRIKMMLIRKYGEDESGWWREGIPKPIRVKCQARREEDIDSPCDPFCYTDVLDLGRIIEVQWALFKDLFPACYASNRKALLDDIEHFNRIRNKVMHPVRGIIPTEDDFDHVHALERNLAQFGNPIRFTQ
jgi:hypothetical protein